MSPPAPHTSLPYDGADPPGRSPEGIPPRDYYALRRGAALVDRSLRGKIEVGGPDAADFLQGLVTNDTASLPGGGTCYAALLTPKARIVADLHLVRDGDRFLAHTEAGAEAAVLEAMARHRIGYRVDVADRTEDLAIVTVAGPKARQVVREAAHMGEPAGGDRAAIQAEHRESRPPMGGAARIGMAGVAALAVPADVGVPAVDLIVETGALGAVRDRLLAAGAIAVSEAAVECVRIEAGMPRLGLDMGPDTMPAEAGIVERAVSFTKGCYVGQEPVARMHHRGHPNRVLRGLRLEIPAAPGSAISRDGANVGRVTSAAVSPELGPIALALVRREVEPPEAVEVEPDASPATVVALPLRSG